jgi:hypothetical protein
MDTPIGTSEVVSGVESPAPQPVGKATSTKIRRNAQYLVMIIIQEGVSVAQLRIDHSPDGFRQLDAGQQMWGAS